MGGEDGGREEGRERRRTGGEESKYATQRHYAKMHEK